jgi:hypothetical protein
MGMEIILQILFQNNVGSLPELPQSPWWLMKLIWRNSRAINRDVDDGANEIEVV